MSKAVKQVKTRAVAQDGSDVGKMRANIYRGAFSRIKAAMEAGYHLEAITLIESLISDRLESRLSYLLGQDFSFKNLGPLIKEVRKEEKDSVLRSLIVEDLDQWRDARNTALHEMAKIAAGEIPDWPKRIAALAPVAENGLALLRKVHRRIAALRRQ